MKRISLFALIIFLSCAVHAQEPSFTWLMDKVYCDSADCFQQRAIEKGFSYLTTEKDDSGTYWTFEADSLSRVTSSQKPLGAKNNMFYALMLNGSVSIGLITKDGGYNEWLLEQIADKGFKEVSIKPVGDDPEYIRTTYDRPDGYSLYDVSSEHSTKIVNGNRITVYLILITKWRKGRQ
jgi:hypothetical protein